MSKKFVAENRYKKTTRTKVKLEKIKEDKKKKNNIKFLVIAIVILVIFISALIGIKCINQKNKKNKEIQENQNFKLANENEFRIGVNKLKTKQPLFSNNLYVNELNKYVYLSLVRIDTDYNIIYEAAKEVQKVNNHEYIIIVNSELNYDVNKKVTVHDIKNTFEQFIKLSNKTEYYDNVNAITELEIIDDNRLKVKLSKDDPYFIYRLQLPVLPITKYNDISKVENDIAPQNVGSIYSVMQTDEKIIYERNKDAKNVYPKKLELIKLDSSETLIEKFKNNEIDMFFTTIEDLSKQLGKYEYNIKEIRNGKSLFLFGNKNSNFFSNKEIRKALAYSINREDIIENVYKEKAVSIDLPYVYSDNKIRHDTIAANNTLINAGFEKIGGLYTKDNKEIIMKLLVNGNDSKLVETAKIIKSSAEECGMRIDLEFLDSASIMNRIRNSTYDLVLTKVSMNEVPDISFINSYININENISNSLKKIEEASVSEIPNEIRRNQNVLNEEMPCIGIISETISLVTKKNIKGFDTVDYLNIFSNLDRVRKVD